MSLLAPPPAMPVLASPFETRARVPGERTITEISVKPADSAPDIRPQTREQRQPGRNSDDGSQPDDPRRGAAFAAAVLAGALPPKPETLHEFYLRVGNSWVPPESELRLRDLEA